MKDPRLPLTRTQSFILILLPMLATFASQRLYLHLAGVRHLYSGGYLVHHLFIGVLILIPSAFLLALGTDRWAVAVATRITLGSGTAMVLDEMVYLIMTHAHDDDYLSPLSLWGAVTFMSLGILLLWAFYRWPREGG